MPSSGRPYLRHNASRKSDLLNIVKGNEADGGVTSHVDTPPSPATSTSRRCSSVRAGLISSNAALCCARRSRRACVAKPLEAAMISATGPSIASGPSTAPVSTQSTMGIIDVRQRRYSASARKLPMRIASPPFLTGIAKS